MLRMDSGSKCTWYKFIKGVGGGGSQIVGVVANRPGGEDNSLLMYG